MINDMSLKAKIRNISKQKNISAQSILQNYLMNRFLYRLSVSEYKDKFVIKGGMLISSIIGIDHRSTMDIDTSLRYLQLNKNNIKKAIEEIFTIDGNDGISFKFVSIEPIRDDDEYGGYRVSFHALKGKINAPMSMDISTGDIITPEASLHIFTDEFENQSFELWSYSIETVLAEKLETVLSRGVDNTRPRDFYDIYMLSGIDYDSELLKTALEATSIHRNSFNKIQDVDSIIRNIQNSEPMHKRWQNYARQMPYAKDISFEDTLEVVSKLLQG